MAAKSAIRHRLEMNNEEISFQEALNLIKFMNNQMESVLKDYPNIPRFETEYETLVSRPLRECKRLASFLDLKFGMIQKIKARKFVVRPANTRT